MAHHRNRLRTLSKNAIVACSLAIRKTLIFLVQCPGNRKSTMIPHRHRSPGNGEGAVESLKKVQFPEVENLQKGQTKEVLQGKKEETKASGIQLIDLPFDVLSYIHDRLALLDYMSFRSVSRSCREAAPALEMRSAMVRSGIQSKSLSPWHVSFHGGLICSFTHPKSVDVYSVEFPEAMQKATIYYYKDDWILSGKQRGENFLVSCFNPFTKNVLSYQEFPKRNSSLTSIGFSSPPTSQRCVIVVLVTLDVTLEVHICHSRENGWHLFQFHQGNFRHTYNCPAFANGAFYFGGLSGKLGVLSLQGEGCHWEILEHPQELCPMNYAECFLAERDGKVFIVLGYNQGQRVGVYSFDPSATSWKRVDNLGKYNLYVNKLCGLFHVAKTTERENRIYFNRFCKEFFVSYSLSTNSLQSYGPTATD